jgi:3-oxoadipate enol-lactonase
MNAKASTPPSKGRESGDPTSIVYLHGYPLDHRIWEPSVTRPEISSGAWLLDLPGYGRSQGIAAPDTLRGFSEWVHRALRARSSEPAIVVGHSFGGYVALQLYRDHPDQFGGLVLTNTRSEADSEEARTKRLETVKRLGRPGEGLDVPATVRALVSPRTWEGQGPVVESLRRIVRSVPSATLIATLQAIASRPDLTPVLEKITVPTLVLWGEEDQLIPPAQTRSMVTRIPGATGAGIPGAGHLPSLEAPDRFSEATRELFRRLPSH